MLGLIDCLFLLHLEFVCKANSSLFILRKNDSLNLMLVYVDDKVITWNQPSIIEQTIS